MPNPNNNSFHQKFYELYLLPTVTNICCFFETTQIKIPKFPKEKEW